MKRGTPDHPKTLMLAHELALPKYAAVGLLESLWHWTAQYAPGGDVGRYADHFIAQAVGWERDAGDLVAALVRCRWLDEHPEHRLVVHHWRDHADDSVHMKLARAGERFADGVAPKLSRLNKADREAAERALSAQPVQHNPCSTVRAAQSVPHATHALPAPGQAKPAPAPSPAAAEAGAGGAESAAEAIAIRAGLNRSAASRLNGTTPSQVLGHWHEVTADGKVKRPGAVLAKRLADHDRAPPLTPAAVASAVNAGIVRAIDGQAVTAPARFNSREVSTDDGQHRFAADTLETASYA